MNQKGENGRGWERQPIFLHSALPLYPIILLLSTPVSLCFQHQRWWLNKKIVFLILPKRMPPLQATILVVVFSPGQVLLANREEKLLSHIAMVAKFISRICYHGNVMSHFSSWFTVLLLLMIYEINYIWTAEMKWKWRNDRRSECNLCNCVKKPEKNSGLQRGLNPWPRDYWCNALPTELWSHWHWEQVNCGFLCSRERNECCYWKVVDSWRNNNKIVYWLYLYTTWFARDITAAMLVVRNKSISPLWKLSSIFR